jgi:hypothetical protein
MVPSPRRRSGEGQERGTKPLLAKMKLKAFKEE